MTEDEKAEHELLAMATDEGKFAIQLGLPLPRYRQAALERLQIRGWVNLVDVSPVALAGDARLCRIFIASAEARAWFQEHRTCH